MKTKTPLLFIIFGLIALLLAMTFGLLAGTQYLLPDFLKESLPFNSLRPYHATSALSWIILCATGGLYFYISIATEVKLHSERLMKIHLWLFVSTGIAIYTAYALGKFGGKEYLEFPAYLIVPIIFGWILFGINYFKTFVGNLKNWPVYYWMWGTGIVFMIFHLSEAYFWLSPYIRNNFIRDLSIQWKAGGSFVGSWNMLVYGTAIYLMSKIKKDDQVGRTKLAFFFYFLGLSNLMFGWAHHVYILPTAPWIRYFAYAINMTEWIILFSMIYDWKKSLSKETIKINFLPYKFLMAADLWIFLNLIIAILFSIPAINMFTHGTHITVAHSMGTTIGINTTILFASVTYILSLVSPDWQKSLKTMVIGYKIFHLSLLIFFFALILAGVQKSIWMYFTKNVAFSEMQDSLYWIYLVFLIFGVGILIGLSLIILPAIKHFIAVIREPKK